MDVATREPTRERELLSLLFGFSQQISGGAALEDLLEEIASAACRLTGGNSASVMLFDDCAGELLCRASAGLPEDEAREISFRLGEGVAGWVAEHRQGVCIDDTAADTRFKSFEEQQTKLRSLCCVPMFSRTGVIGVITAGASRTVAFDAEDQQLLEYMAAAIAKDVENGRLYRMAVTDALTGAFNRQFLSDRLQREMERHLRYDQPLSVLVVDIDHFKLVNDRWGHPVGDMVLRELAHRLDRMVRDVDSLVRYGGEEFVIILPCTAVEGARLVAERLRHQVATRPIRVQHSSRDGTPVRITLSVGVSEMARDDRDATKLITRADAALYRAKSRGRNCVVATGDA